eukprot:m.658299 g.658299  ORF g.658299 m.658299 type:complete len:180 (+) comp22716_c0_seq61:871-1410(+)
MIRGVSAVRFSGGTRMFIERLLDYVDTAAQRMPNNVVVHMHYNAPVTKIVSHARTSTASGTTSVHVAQGTTSSIISASAVILAVPPQALAAAVEFDPQLPPSLSDAMATTRTWMHGIVKIAVSYSRPFWREQQLSGSANVQRPGNVFQVTWDNSDDKNGTLVLFRSQSISFQVFSTSLT